ncbi:MAG: hypothetical protein GY940_48280, partial [bacterium]|nr:hypothetical protein [bacterium]
MTNKNKTKITLPETPQQVTVEHIDFIAEEVMEWTKGSVYWRDENGDATKYVILEPRHIGQEDILKDKFNPFSNLSHAWITAKRYLKKRGQRKRKIFPNTFEEMLNLLTLDAAPFFITRRVMEDM